MVALIIVPGDIATPMQEKGYTKTGVSAAILAGGRSSRMGTNKALLRLPSVSGVPGGPTMIEVVAARLREAGLEPALLVSNDPASYSFMGMETISDDVPGAGPLGGIVTALMRSHTESALIVACDMPLLSVPLLIHMARLANSWEVGEANAFVPRWTDEGGKERVEPLHTIYSRRCIEPLLRRLEKGKLKLASALSELNTIYIEEEEIRRYNPAMSSFRNINTPEEWAQLVGTTGCNE